MKHNVKRHAVVQPLDQSIKLIPLTHGKNAVVDAADYEQLSKWNWYGFENHGHFYAARSIRMSARYSRIRYMHHEVLGCDGSNMVDHRDNDGLNNRKSNLRFCTHTQNRCNATLRANNKSGFKGVHFHAATQKWGVHITVNKSRIHIGEFVAKEEAARAYDSAALEHFGEFASLNFPHVSP